MTREEVKMLALLPFAQLRPRETCTVGHCCEILITLKILRAGVLS